MLKQHEYPDLSDFAITFDPLTYSDKRWREIFQDKYAKIIFVGFRIQHLMSEKGIDILIQESVTIGNEIRNGELTLKHEPLKERLKEMYMKIYEGHAVARDNDINDEFVTHLLPYLKGEKPFRYKIKQK